MTLWPQTLNPEPQHLQVTSADNSRGSTPGATAERKGGGSRGSSGRRKKRQGGGKSGGAGGKGGRRGSVETVDSVLQGRMRTTVPNAATIFERSKLKGVLRLQGHRRDEYLKMLEYAPREGWVAPEGGGAAEGPEVMSHELPTTSLGFRA